MDSQPVAEINTQTSTALEDRIAALEDRLKKLEEIVREHFAAPDHHTNLQPLRELQAASRDDPGSS